MAQEQLGFRPVLIGGFHKGDVCAYVERLVLKQENEREEWRRREAAIQEEYAALQEQYEQLAAERNALEEKILALEAQREGEEGAVSV